MKLEWEKATDTTSQDTGANNKLKPYFHFSVGDITVKNKAELNKYFVSAGQVVQIDIWSAKIFTISNKNIIYCIIFL